MKSVVALGLLALSSAGHAAPPGQPLYVATRIGLGYGAFDSAEHRDGSATWPASSASGFLVGFGLTVAVPIATELYLGGVANFDPLLSPSGQTEGHGEAADPPAILFNGTFGVALVWEPSDSVAMEFVVGGGGGGAKGLAAGGFGLHLQVQAWFPVATFDGGTFGPELRVTYAPLMTDLSRGNDVTYFSIDAGVTIRPW